MKFANPKPRFCDFLIPYAARRAAGVIHTVGCRVGRHAFCRRAI